MAAPLIVFDLDGTLVDTAPDLIDTLNVLLAREGVPPVGLDDARSLVGAGIRPLIERGLAARGVDAPRAHVDALYATYLELYAARIAELSRPFPGVDAALDRLEAAGCRFAVCTNKLEGLSLRLLDALDLTRRFAAICGQDTFGIAKPDPEILLRTIARAGGSAGRAVMVGDSATDIRTARAAGIPVVAVTFGYTDTPVETLSPDRLIGHFDDLPAATLQLVDTFQEMPDLGT